MTVLLFEEFDAAPRAVTLPTNPEVPPTNFGLADDGSAGLWLGAGTTIYHLNDEMEVLGEIEAQPPVDYQLVPGDSKEGAIVSLAHAAGQVWISLWGDTFVHRYDAGTGEWLEPVSLDGAILHDLSIFQFADGHLWFPAALSNAEYRPAVLAMDVERLTVQRTAAAWVAASEEETAFIAPDGSATLPQGVTFAAPTLHDPTAPALVHDGYLYQWTAGKGQGYVLVGRPLSGDGDERRYPLPSEFTQVSEGGPAPHSPEGGPPSDGLLHGFQFQAFWSGDGALWLLTDGASPREGQSIYAALYRLRLE